MEVTDIIFHGRSSLDGKPRSGEVTFSDGKVWRWHRSHHDKEFYFVISSGIPSQWGWGDYGRNIAPPKRIAALKSALDERGEL